MTKSKTNTKAEAHPPHHHPRLSHRARWIITLAVIGLLCYVLAPQTDAFWRSFSILSTAAWLPVAIAGLTTIMTYALSAEVYHTLLKHAIPLRRVFLVQAASALTSRIAPIGVGTMGLNAFFLKRQGHTTAESLAVVAANNGIGFVGHIILVALALLAAPLPGEIDLIPSSSTIYWILLGIFIVGLLLTFYGRLRRRILHGLRELLSALASYRHQRGKLLQAFFVSLALSVVYVLSLQACAIALGVSLSFSQIFLVYSFSLLTGAATPTPGGLVGVEAGIVGGMLAYGVGAETALAVALLYRLISYWLPLLPGFIAFRVVQHRYL